MDKSKRIQTERNKLLGVYSSLAEDELILIDGLINEAAGMKIELEDLRKDLSENGHWEKFSQSKDLEPYERERPASRIYSSMNRNYQSIIKQLASYLPDGNSSGAEEIMKFITGKNELG